MDSHQITPRKQRVLVISTYVFSGVYAIELIIKLLGMRKYYFKSPWNIFDLVIFSLCMFGKLLDFL